MAFEQIGQVHFSTGRSFTSHLQNTHSTGVTKKKFIIDAESDVASLPECDPGSLAIMADGSCMYVVNASRAWTKMTNSGGAAALAVAEEVLF